MSNESGEPACIIFEVDWTRNSDGDGWETTKYPEVVCSSEVRAVKYLKADVLGKLRAAMPDRQWRYRHEGEAQNTHRPNHVIEYAERGEGTPWHLHRRYVLTSIGYII